MDGNKVLRLFVGTINWQAKMYRDKMIPFILSLEEEVQA